MLLFAWVTGWVFLFSVSVQKERVKTRGRLRRDDKLTIRNVNMGKDRDRGWWKM